LNVVIAEVMTLDRQPRGIEPASGVMTPCVGRTLLSDAFDFDFDFDLDLDFDFDSSSSEALVPKLKNQSQKRRTRVSDPHTPQNLPVVYNSRTEIMRSRLAILITAGALMLGSSASTLDKPMDFGPNNPFYAPSTLPFHAPPFEKIKDSDYQPAIDAGMAEQRLEIRAIADNPAPPTFEEHICRPGKDRPVVQPRHGRIQRRHGSEPESGTAESAGLRGTSAGRT
jgi:hypothetical protein